jgi:hypothetical protein
MKYDHHQGRKAILFLFLLLVSCTLDPASTPAPVSAPNPLAGTVWILIKIHDMPALPEYPVYLFLESGRLRGEMGCNSYRADYHEQNSALQIDLLTVTVQLCRDAELMDQEERYIQTWRDTALLDPSPYRLISNNLEILDSSGSVVLLFETAITGEPVPSSLIRPTPTSATGLLQRMPESFLSLPEGLRMDIYPMTVQAFEEAGYEPYLRALGEQSLLAALTQGRTYWDTADLALMETNNAALAPFGYRLASQPVEADTGARWFTLYRGDEVLIDPVTSLGRVSVNQSGSNFLLLVDTTRELQLVQNGSVEPWQTSLPSGAKIESAVPGR